MDAPKWSELQVKGCTLFFAVSAGPHRLSCLRELELASLSCLTSLEDLLVTSPGVEDAAISDREGHGYQNYCIASLEN